MHSHHQIDYIEFSVGDLPRAKAFFAAAFGWKFTDYGPGYAGIQGETREQGGLALRDAASGAAESDSGGPLVILYSDDLDASRNTVVKAGGTIKMEPFVFPGGRRFHFVDTEGNELAVWTER